MMHETARPGRLKLAAGGIMFALAVTALPMAAARSQDTVYTDPLYRYQLPLPAGWVVSAAPPGAVMGASVFFNYDPDLAWQTGRLPPDALKIQIGLAPLPAGQTTAAWSARWRASQVAGAAGSTRLATSPPAEIQVGRYPGVRFTLDEAGGGRVIEIDLRLNATQVAVVGITAAQPGGEQQAMHLLAGLEPDAAYAFSAEQQAAADRWAAGPDPHLPAAADAVAACPTGTYPGDEAPHSPISLTMPFLPGQDWMVGGYGSFYGNNMHCNANHEYYATDWNRMDARTAGSAILPVADGTIVVVQEPACPTTSYGCYVQVDHAGVVRTRYAHLQGLYRTSGAVTTRDPLGAAGSTGNSTGPHLHLSFQIKTGAAFYSNCFNGGQTCANGEAPVSPQTARPSPMYTASGFQELADWRRYISADITPTGEARLFSAPGLTGTLVFTSGPGFSNTPERDAQSMALPAGWSAKTWRGNDRQGEMRCWSASVPNLQAYGWADAIDSIEVFARYACPPPAPVLIEPVTGSLFSRSSAIVLSWQTAAPRSLAEISASNGMTISLGWQAGASATLTSTAPGLTYAWRVMARDLNGDSPWSAWRTFCVLPLRAFLPLAVRDGPRSRLLFADHFDTNTLPAYTIAGSAAWDGAAKNVVFGGQSSGGRIIMPLSLGRSFTVTGRLLIPAAGVGPFDSAAVAVRDGQVEYWASLAYGTDLGQKDHLSIMRNDTWGELYALPLAPGWYHVGVEVDYATGYIRMKAWPDDAIEPGWQLTRTLDAGWTAAGAGLRHFGAGARADDLVMYESLGSPALEASHATP